VIARWRNDAPVPANAGPFQAPTVFVFSWNEITFGKLLDLLREAFEIYQLVEE
jgi:hypothetical protein